MMKFMYFYMFFFFIHKLTKNFKFLFIQNFIMLMTFFIMLNINMNNFFFLKIYWWMAMDKWTFMLILLTLWISSLMFLSSNKITKFCNMYMYMILILSLFMIFSFLSINYFMFYLFFECSLIPIFFMIMGWGYQPERTQASIYLIIYTIFASLPLLIIMFLIFNYHSSLNYLFIINNNMFMKFNNLSMLLFYFFMIFAFLVKLPLYLIHLWLPKAHVEAPIAGSMILASIMLKLGSYGMLRSLTMMKNYSKSFNYMLISLSLYSMMILSIMCMTQIDMKMLVAYSSIIHMMLMLLGLLFMSNLSFMGSLMMMIGHGLNSSGLFCLVNFNYERSNSRMIMINKGMIMIMPNISLWWFLMCISNMAAPPSLNLFSEIEIICKMINYNNMFMFILMISMIFNAFYNIFLFSLINHGKFFNNFKMFMNNNIREFLIIIYHWIPLNFLILKINFFL
uniref:NADH-ubiquinone oxidoreductase chain 4 n=1 Tax=Monomachus antipodalis TaxID=161211 RepID=A0A0E3ID25_9HYME|nr:NADH dehydrogenase subunit 4 [Monomachus antipodalis]